MDNLVINNEIQQPIIENIYIPTAHELIYIEQVTEIEWLFRVKYDKEVKAGQFIQVSIPRVGEAPISIANFNKEEGWLDFLIRKVGKVTDVLFKLGVGDKLFLRGPYGNGFPIEQYKNKHLVLVVGGSGIAPVRPIIEYFYENFDEVKSLKIIVGFKNKDVVIFKNEFDRWREKFDILVTLDSGQEEGMKEGLVTKYIPETVLPENYDELEYIVVGPPMMMHFSCLEVLKRNVPKEKIWVSFERKMSCAVGKCGHCKIDETYVCLEGPVFRYDVAEKLLD